MRGGQSTVFRELEDRWILDLGGEHVDSVHDDGMLSIRLDGGTEITVNGNALVSKGPITAPGSAFIRVADMSEDALQELVGAAVVSGVAFKSGPLRIVFSTGQHLNVRAADDEVSAQIRQPESYDWSYRDQSAHMVVHAS